MLSQDLQCSLSISVGQWHEEAEEEYTKWGRLSLGFLTRILAVVHGWGEINEDPRIWTMIKRNHYLVASHLDPQYKGKMAVFLLSFQRDENVPLRRGAKPCQAGAHVDCIRGFLIQTNFY